MEAHNNKEVLEASRVLHAQTHIWNHIFSFINSMSLKSAIDLNIIDTIHNHGKPMPLPTLISTIQIHPSKNRHIYRLMRILTHSGFFSLESIPKIDDDDQSQELGYVLTDASTLLLKDNPFSMTPFLQAMLDPVLTKPWYKLAEWFQNDNSTPFDMVHGGKMLWEYAGQEPQMNKFFNEAMTGDVKLVMSVVLEKCKGVFKGLESLVDVGGATGTTAKAIAEAFPEIECSVFDLPRVIGGLQNSGNLKFVSGDMFHAVPPADAIMFKSILHNWNDEECVKILKKCKEAITTNKGFGKVIIIDMVMKNNDKGNSVILGYVDDGFADRKREKRRRMGQFDIFFWFQ